MSIPYQQQKNNPAQAAQQEVADPYRELTLLAGSTFPQSRDTQDNRSSSVGPLVIPNADRSPTLETTIVPKDTRLICQHEDVLANFNRPDDKEIKIVPHSIRTLDDIEVNVNDNGKFTTKQAIAVHADGAEIFYPGENRSVRFSHGLPVKLKEGAEIAIYNPVERLAA